MSTFFFSVLTPEKYTNISVTISSNYRGKCNQNISIFYNIYIVESVTKTLVYFIIYTLELLTPPCNTQAS